MSDTDETLKRIAIGHEIRGDRDYSEVSCFCHDLHKDNWAGNPSICNQKEFNACPECFGCEAGNHMLRYLKEAL